MIRAVIYARVSSKKQRDGNTIESQLRALPLTVAARGWKLVDTYIDDGKSAKAGKLHLRSGLARMLDDADAGRFDVVVVWDIDRLTRSEDLTERGQILGRLQRANVQIVAGGADIDLSTGHGDMMISFQAAAAAEFNRKLAERTKAGKLVAISRGRKPAGPTPYGYRYDRATFAWSIDEDEAAIVREAFARVVAGESCSAIADDLTARGVPRPRSPIWQRERVWQIVSASTARGEWVADKRRKLVVPVPPIVDAATWYAAQDALVRHGRRGLRRTQHVYLLEGGTAACAVCGGRIGIASAISRGPAKFRAPARYVCSHRRRPRPGAARCELAVRRVAEVDERIWESLRATILRPSLLDRAVKAWRARHRDERSDWQEGMRRDEERLRKLETTEQALLARFRRGAVGERALDVELDAIGRERADIKRRMQTTWKEQAASAASRERAESVEQIIADLRRRADAATVERRRELVERLFDPGSVILGDWSIEATVRLRSPSLVSVPGSSSVARDILQILVIA